MTTASRSCWTYGPPIRTAESRVTANTTMTTTTIRSPTRYESCTPVPPRLPWHIGPSTFGLTAQAVGPSRQAVADVLGSARFLAATSAFAVAILAKACFVVRRVRAGTELSGRLKAAASAKRPARRGKRRQRAVVLAVPQGSRLLARVRPLLAAARLTASRLGRGPKPIFCPNLLPPARQPPLAVAAWPSFPPTHRQGRKSAGLRRPLLTLPAPPARP